jgi:hypothetical protein
MLRVLLPVLLAGSLSWHPALFAAEQEDKEQKGENAPLPGELVLPAGVEGERKEKQCMTVCARWGEECILINKGAGGMDRRCRRTCQEFAEECF